ncbi:hypothetical protein CH381_33360 [Leptospira sp. mixed culture ATI2-C-A1]|nr:hypothetical protein CH381_33360 [Leptospira sp. mixed culture ATI2-C-A1]
MFDLIKKNKLIINQADFKKHILNGMPIVSKIFNFDINLHKLKFIKKEIDLTFSFENCIFNNVDFSFHTFEKRIKFRNCIFNDFFAMSVFYPEGFEMINCNITENFDVCCGGHNLNDSFILENTTINGFANFQDCLFMNKVFIKNNIFVNGSNILGNSILGTEVEFQKEFYIENNLGNIHVHH